MSTEKNLLDALKRGLPRVDFLRIETMTLSGVPDVNYAYENGIEGWIELKMGNPRLKPSQVAWHTRAIANHRRAFILTLLKDSYVLYRTNRFIKVDSVHFTPEAECLICTPRIADISNCLTKTY